MALVTGKPDRLSSKTYGIVEGVDDATERPYSAIREAMAVNDVPSDTKLATGWANESAAWTTANPGWRKLDDRRSAHRRRGSDRRRQLGTLARYRWNDR